MCVNVERRRCGAAAAVGEEASRILCIFRGVGLLESSKKGREGFPVTLRGFTFVREGRTRRTCKARIKAESSEIDTARGLASKDSAPSALRRSNQQYVVWSRALPPLLPPPLLSFLLFHPFYTVPALDKTYTFIPLPRFLGIYRPGSSLLQYLQNARAQWGDRGHRRYFSNY